MGKEAGPTTLSTETTNLFSPELADLQNQIRQIKNTAQYHPTNQEKTQYAETYQQYINTSGFPQKIESIYSLANSLGITDQQNIDSSLKSAIYHNLWITNKTPEFQKVDKLAIADACTHNFQLVLESFIRLKPEKNQPDQDLIFRIAQNPHCFTPDVYEQTYLENIGDDFTYPYILRKLIMKFNGPQNVLSEKRQIYYQLLQDPELSTLNISKFRLRKIACDYHDPKGYILKNKEKFLRQRPRIRPHQETYTFKKSSPKKPSSTTKPNTERPITTKNESRQNLNPIPETYPQYQQYLQRQHPFLSSRNITQYFQKYPNAPEIIETDIQTYEAAITKYKKDMEIPGLKSIITESIFRYRDKSSIYIDKYIYLMTQGSLYKNHEYIPESIFLGILFKYFFKQTVDVRALTKSLDQEAKLWQ